MDIIKLLEKIPDSIKQDIMDFKPVKLKDGRYAIRVLIDRLLTDEETQSLSKNKHIVCADGVATYKYAPEIKKSYFYVV